MKSIGKIAQWERKNTKASSSYNVEDESSTFELRVEDSENESHNSFDEMLNDSLKNSQTKHNKENSMQIIVPNLPKMNVKELRLPVERKCSYDESDTITEVSRNSTIHTFTSTIATNSKHPVEKKITDLSDLVRYFTVPKTIKKSVASEEDRCMSNKIMQTNIRGWLGMVNLTQTCTNQVIKAICPGPSQSQLRHILGVKLSTSPNMTSSQ